MLLGAKILHFFETPKCLREFYGLMVALSFLFVRPADRPWSVSLFPPSMLFNIPFPQIPDGTYHAFGDT